VFTGSFLQSGSVNVNGGVTANSFTGSLLGTASFAISSSYAQSASYANSSSYAVFAQTASHAEYSITASYASASTSASYANSSSYAATAISASSAISASYANSASYATIAISASYAQSASFSNSSSYAATAISSSYAESSSYANSSSYAATAISSSYAINATSASYVNDLTQSVKISGSLIVNGDITSTGTITAQQLNVQVITSSVDFVTGSTRFGSLLTNTHLFTGSVSITGSLDVNGPLNVTNGITGSLFGTASFAISASHAQSASYANSSSYAATAISASYANSSSYAATAISASYAESGSYANSSSYGVYAQSASHAEYSITASYASASTSASYANSASYAAFAQTASHAQYAISASYASASTSASYSDVAVSASYAQSASHANSSSYAATAISSSYSSVATSASYAVDATNAVSASWITGSNVVGTVASATSASYALTASYAENVPATASFAISASQAESASYALTASFAMNGGGGGLSALYIQDEGVTQGTASYIDFVGAGVTATVSGGTASINIGGGGSAVQGASQTFTQSIAANTWSFAHGINSRTPVVEVYDSNYNVIIPSAINNPGPFQTNIFFDVAQSGFAIISTGGLLAVSGSNAILNVTSASTTWSFNHDLHTQYPVFTIYDSNDDVIIPQRINVVDTASAVIYFSTPRTGKAVASLGGNINFASSSLSASYAVTASYANTATSASYSLVATSASYALNTTSASYAFSATSASHADNSISSSYALTASYLENYIPPFPFTGSAAISGSLVVNGDITATGTITAQQLNVQIITSSVIYSSGSNIFGNDLANTQVLTGSVSITGSLAVNGSNVILTNQTSSMSVLSASYAISASHANSSSFALYAQTASYAINPVISGSINNVNYIDFNTSATVTQPVAGRLSWNNSDGTLDLGMKGGNVTQQIGQEIFYEIRNETTSSILNGTSLYANGVTAGSGRITAAPFVADGNTREVRYLGLATENISTGVNGFVTYFGYVRDLDTRGTNPSSIAVGDENWSVGDILYAHPTVPGKLTNVRPKHEIIVAIIIIRHQSTGVLFVRPSSFGHLDDIHDVIINTGSLSTGDLLIYDSGSDYWTNSKQLFGSYGLTGSLNATSFTGSLLGTASFATSASYALTSSYSLSGTGFPFSGSAVITGSLLVSGSGITGSLEGTASYAISASQAESSSYAISASFATYANNSPGYTVQFSQSVAAMTWSFTHNLNTRNPIVQVYDTDYKQIIPNDIVGIDVNNAEVRFDYNQAGYVVMSNGGGLYVTGSTSELVQTVGATTWSFTHNLNSKYVNFEVYDSNDYVIIPAGIRVLTTNTAELYFATLQTGRAVAQFSGINGAPNATTASYAVTATSASYALNTTSASYANVATSASFAETAVTASYLNPIVSSYVVLTQVSESLNFADDASAAAGGVPLGGLYRNGNFILIRIS
jgi:hypothetical protein